MLRNLSKIVKNVEENENNSIFEKISNKSNILPTNPILKKPSDKINYDSKSKTLNNLKTTIDTTGRHSVEASFVQLLFKDFMRNMNKSAHNMYNRLTMVNI